MRDGSLGDSRRLAAMRRLRLLDTPPEEPLDRLTRLAARILRAPIALVSLVDERRQFFKSAYGLPRELAERRETPVSHSFCQHVVRGKRPLVVKDATQDPELRENPGVTRMGMVAYAGMPLTTQEGEPLGSFCVIDSKPREWTSEQLELLQELADAAMREIELRDLGNQLVREQRIRQEVVHAVTSDLMDPLRRLVTGLQAAGPGGLAPEGVREVLTEAQRLTIKVNDLVDVASLDAGALQPRLASVSVVPLVEAALERVSDVASELRIGIEVRLPDRLPNVLADPQLVLRALVVLLRHALRFTDVGSLVFVEACETGSGDVRCSVSDTGVGLTDEVRSGVFCGYLPDAPHPLESLPQSGLGLTFCRMAIEAMGGEIGVFSHEGVGSTFWFTLSRA